MLSNAPTKYSLIKAILVELLLIGVGLVLYSLFPFFQFYFLGLNEFGIYDYPFLIENGLFYLAIVYIMVIPILFYRYQKEGRTPKSLTVLQKIINSEFDQKFWFCLRVFGLKFLFIPLMFLGTLYFGDIAISNLFSIVDKNTLDWNWINWINDYLFASVINTLMMAVLIVYTFGYCVESDLFENRIKSVDDSWFSWAVTIICYAPFFPIAAYVIPLASQDFAFFINHEITAVVRILIMIIVGLKAWSIFTLGTRSSNLTNRGIESGGPYRWVRHPHYLFKLMVLWIGVMPSMIQNYWLIGGMIFWTTIYVLRALMEEQHLKRDEDYKAYMKKVKWHFIPGVF